MQDQLTAAMNVYVEEALGLHVGELVRFVRAAEAAAKQQNVPEGLPVPGYGPPEAAPIMKDFASRWTSAIEALNKYADPLTTVPRHDLCAASILAKRSESECMLSS